ncbi:uncharacterized protein TNCV_1458731 [Trichonephila clavipes]|nr:uncharacterized protein TNCV_1458731 [Trichonephila clavipes]
MHVKSFEAQSPPVGVVWKLGELDARSGGHGSRVVKISDRGWCVTSSCPVPLKIRRVGERCTLNLSRVQTTSRWCVVAARRGGCQLRCPPRHLTMVQNYELPVCVIKSPQASVIWKVWSRLKCRPSLETMA